MWTMGLPSIPSAERTNSDECTPLLPSVRTDLDSEMAPLRFLMLILRGGRARVLRLIFLRFFLVCNACVAGALTL